LNKFLNQNENEMEYYLSHPDRNVRLILTKLSLSEHKLLIEIGRSLNVLEDFLFECKRNTNTFKIYIQIFLN
jgi:hypothetical protein